MAREEQVEIGLILLDHLRQPGSHYFQSIVSLCAGVGEQLDIVTRHAESLVGEIIKEDCILLGVHGGEGVFIVFYSDNQGNGVAVDLGCDLSWVQRFIFYCNRLDLAALQQHYFIGPVSVLVNRRDDHFPVFFDVQGLTEVAVRESYLIAVYDQGSLFKPNLIENLH